MKKPYKIKFQCSQNEIFQVYNKIFLINMLKTQINNL